MTSATGGASAHSPSQSSLLSLETDRVLSVLLRRQHMTTQSCTVQGPGDMAGHGSSILVDTGRGVDAACLPAAGKWEACARVQRLSVHRQRVKTHSSTVGFYSHLFFAPALLGSRTQLLII